MHDHKSAKDEKPSAHGKGKTDPLDEDVLVRKLNSWHLMEGFAGGAKIDTKIKFRPEMIETEMLDDFDLTSEDVCIWPCKSIFNYPYFVRIHSSPSLWLFTLDSFIRSTSIRIYSNHIYRGFINFIIIFQLLLIYWNPFSERQSSFYSICFLVIYTVDMIFTIISKGLIVNEYAYLSTRWNWFDSAITIFQWFNYFQIPLIGSLGSDYIKFDRLIEALRGIRLINEVQKIDILRELRLIIGILVRLVPAILQALLIFLSIMILSTLFMYFTMATVGDHICYPMNSEISFELANRIIDETIQDPDNEDELVRFKFRTYFDIDYDYHPCYTSYWLPMSYQCGAHEQCVAASETFRRIVGRPMPSDLDFKSMGGIWLLSLMLISNEEYDPTLLRVVYHTGLPGFLFNVFMYLFGFCTFSFFLAIISDIYEQELEAKRSVRTILTKYVTGFAEFTFDTSSMHVVPAALNTENRHSWLKQGHSILCATRHSHRAEISQHISMSDVITHETRKENQHRVRFHHLHRLISSHNYQTFIAAMVLIHSGSFILAKSNLDWFHVDFDDNYSFASRLFFMIGFLCTIVFCVEMLLAFAVYGVAYFRFKFANLFDLAVTLCCVAFQLNVHFPSNIFLFAGHFRFFRILRVITNMWSALQIISQAISMTLNSLLITLSVFMVIFVNLSFLANRLFDSIESNDNQEFEDLVLSYDTVYNSIFSVFCQIFASAWQESYDYYVSLELDQPLPQVVSITIFIAVSFLMHLMFVDLIVPEVLNNLDINLLIGDTHVIAQVKPYSFEIKNMMARNLIRKVLFEGFPIFLNHHKFEFYSRALSFAVNVDAIFSLFEIFFSYSSEKYYSEYLTFGILMKMIVLSDLIIRMFRRGLVHYFLGCGSSKFLHLILAMVDLSTFFISSFSIVFGFTYGYFYYGRKYMNVYKALIVLKTLSFLRGSKVSAHLRGVFNVMIVSLFILSMLDALGVNIFQDRLTHCLVIDASYDEDYSNRTGFKGQPDQCVYAEDRIYDMDALSGSTLLKRYLYEFNFDDIFTGLATILQLNIGDAVWQTMIMLTSSSGTRAILKRESNKLAWLFLVPVLFTGFLIESLLFSVVAELVAAQSLTDEVYMKEATNTSDPENRQPRTDGSIRRTYIALCTFKNLTPWSLIPEPLNYIEKKLCSCLNSIYYDNILLMIISLNCVNFLFHITFETTSIPAIIFLIIYCADALIHLAVVGWDYRQYPLFFASDVLLPFILFTLDMSSVAEEVHWSLLIVLRLLLPERTLRGPLMWRPRVILNSLITQINTNGRLIIFICLFLGAMVNIGMSLFSYQDNLDIKYSEKELPPVYRNPLMVFAHLFSITFGRFFDVSILEMTRRSKFCLLQTKAIHLDIIDDDEILKTFMKNRYRPEFRAIDVVSLAIFPPPVLNLSLIKPTKIDEMHGTILDDNQLELDDGEIFFKETRPELEDVKKFFERTSLNLAGKEIEDLFQGDPEMRTVLSFPSRQRRSAKNDQKAVRNVNADYKLPIKPSRIVDLEIVFETANSSERFIFYDESNFSDYSEQTVYVSSPSSEEEISSPDVKVRFLQAIFSNLLNLYESIKIPDQILELLVKEHLISYNEERDDIDHWKRDTRIDELDADSMIDSSPVRRVKSFYRRRKTKNRRSRRSTDTALSESDYRDLNRISINNIYDHQDEQKTSISNVIDRLTLRFLIDPFSLIECSSNFYNTTKISVNEKFLQSFLVEIEREFNRRLTPRHATYKLKINREKISAKFRPQTLHVELLATMEIYVRRMLFFATGIPAKAPDMLLGYMMCGDFFMFRARIIGVVIVRRLRHAIKASVEYEDLSWACSSRWEIMLFYFVFIFICKWFILNIFRATTLTGYRMQKDRAAITIDTDTVALFVRLWRQFVREIEGCKTERILPFIGKRDFTRLDRMSAKQVSFFITRIAPMELRLPVRSEAQVHYMLAKYELPLRVSDMSIHLVDLLVVAVAINCECNENADLKAMIQDLKPYIHRNFYGYDFNAKNTITMEQYVKGFFLGSMVMCSVVKSHLRKDGLLIEKEDTAERMKRKQRRLQNQDNQNEHI